MKKRSSGGMTLTELMVASILIGFSMAAVSEFAAVNTFATTKLINKVDGQVGTSRAIRRIAADIRQARIIGNINARYSHRNEFPDASSAADYFSNAPVGGWPSAPWPSTPYSLSSQTLILQQPVFFKDPALASNPSAINALNGFPLRVAPGTSNPDGPPYVECLNTVVYQVIPDGMAPGQYILQVARFVPSLPSDANTLSAPALTAPQTVLKGIVGPINPADPASGPCVFQYLEAPNGSTVYPVAKPPWTATETITGVSINLEVQSPSTNQGANKEIIAVHAESFMKATKNLRFSND